MPNIPLMNGIRGDFAHCTPDRFPSIGNNHTKLELVIFHLPQHERIVPKKWGRTVEESMRVVLPKEGREKETNKGQRMRTLFSSCSRKGVQGPCCHEAPNAMSWACSSMSVAKLGRA